MELTYTRNDNGLYEVIVTDASGKTLRRFFTTNVDRLGALEPSELEQQVEDGLI